MTVQDTRTRTRKPVTDDHSPLRYIGKLSRLEDHARGAFYAGPLKVSVRSVMA